MQIPLSSIYKINNVAIPEPSECSVDVYPLHGEDSGRTADGKMHTTVISVKRKVDLTYKYISQSELSTLLTKLNVQYYNLTYRDPIDGAKAIECYGTDLTQVMHHAVLYNGLWRDVKISCIER